MRQFPSLGICGAPPASIHPYVRWFLWVSNMSWLANFLLAPSVPGKWIVIQIGAQTVPGWSGTRSGPPPHFPPVPLKGYAIPRPHSLQCSLSVTTTFLLADVHITLGYAPPPMSIACGSVVFSPPPYLPPSSFRSGFLVLGPAQRFLLGSTPAGAHVSLRSVTRSSCPLRIPERNINQNGQPCGV